MGSHSLRGYANGFLEIASIASVKTIDNKCAIDTIMPAILYNIRHSVELFLKSVLSEIGEGTDSEIIATGHEVKTIFSEYKKQIETLLEYEYNTVSFSYKEWLAGFESIINLVDIFDGDGQTMRYPTDRKGKPNLEGKARVSTNDVLCLIKYIQSYYDEYNNRGT